MQRCRFVPPQLSSPTDPHQRMHQICRQQHNKKRPSKAMPFSLGYRHLGSCFQRTSRKQMQKNMMGADSGQIESN
eukprot:scaffold2181_cov153-Amphora_coffeaeformis.AAC.4